MRHVLIALVVVLALALAGACYTVLIPEARDHFSSPPPPPPPLLRLPAVTSAASLPPVLDPTSTRPPSSASLTVLEHALLARLAAPSLGTHVGFALAPLTSSAPPWRHGVATVMPASTMKLLTTTAALSVLGPEHPFVTTVVRGSRGQIVLVGGGDPLLAARNPTPAQAAGSYPQPATLEDLARSTATALRAQGLESVRLGYDTTLFSGPAVNPRWPSTYIPENVVSPISPLWVNEGREHPGLAARSVNPALAATEQFDALLRADGIRVVGAPSAATAPPAGTGPARVLASVSSAPLREIVEHILELSDNEGAEVLMRQVALADGSPGSSTAGVVAVRAALAELGLHLDGATFFDGSGLSRDDVVPVTLLLAVLRLDDSPAHPALSGVIGGLPVAGFSGSLSYRFVADAPQGDGYVRAKTGTLSGVSGLAGIALTRSGQALAFVVVADRINVEATLDARAALDAVAATIAQCDCRSG